MANSLSEAKRAWQNLLGPAGVVENAQELYGPNTTGHIRAIPLALLPTNIDQVQKIVVIANQYKVPLYVVSTGKNWGYGTANPVTDGCVILDLSKMNQILAIDEELSWVRVQPGVTQGQLFDYLRENNYDFLVPVTGGGPKCSLLGNALERGYGITPHIDHFGALLSIKAVLPDGNLYSSPLEQVAGQEVANNFRSGVGPYLDGIFSQSNLGIVVEAVIALARKPEACQAFFFEVNDETKLGATVEAIRKIMQVLGSNVGGINLMNQRRMLAMRIPYPAGLSEGETIDAVELTKIARKQKVALWTGFGALYGTKEIVRASRSVIKRMMRGKVNRLVFVSPKEADLLNKLTHLIPGNLGEVLQRFTTQLVSGIEILTGKPNNVAHPLCYWQSNVADLGEKLKDPDPARDGCGLLWYSPLVPMRAEKVIDYVEWLTDTCVKHGIEPLITLTGISERCFDSTVPILFDAGSVKHIDRAHCCYRQLLSEGKARGFFPYRFGIDHMNLVVDEHQSFWHLVTMIKKSLDPANILSPGRYSDSQN